MNEPPVAPLTPATPAPSPDARRAKLRRVAIGAVAVWAAVAAVWLATRERGAAAEDSGAGATSTASGAVDSPIRLTTEQAAALGLTYTVAERTPFRTSIDARGEVTVDERRITHVASTMAGRVERVFVPAGARVRAGQPLISIHSPAIVAAQEELLLARNLAFDVSAGTPTVARRAADLAVLARKRVEALGVPPAEITAIEQRGRVRPSFTLVSPVAGVVLSKAVVVGQEIRMRAPIYRIGDLRVVRVDGSVDGAGLAAARVGQSVTVTPEALRVGVPGKVVRVDSTGRVVVEVANPDSRLRPGMEVTMRIESGRRDSVLSVPREAVQQSGGKSLVYVQRDDLGLESREVRTGDVLGDRVEIVEGLAAGERVVASARMIEGTQPR